MKLSIQKRALAVVLTVALSVLVYKNFSSTQVQPSPDSVPVVEGNGKRGSSTAPERVSSSSDETIVTEMIVPRPETDEATDFLSLSHDEQAALLLGLPMGEHKTVASYFAALESDIASGDFSKSTTAAILYSQCARMRNSDALHKADHVSHPVAKACSDLPDRDSNYAANLVESAAEAGNREAILRQFGFAPTEVMSNPSGMSDPWVHRAVARIERLAEFGDPEAVYLLASRFSSEEFGLRDLEKAKANMARFVGMTTGDDPRRALVQAQLERLCGTALPADWRDPCKG